MKSTSRKLQVDPADGLVVSDAGPWAAEKHRLLRDYVGATWAVREKFRKAGHPPAYIDVFSGPGRTLIEETGGLADGSPVVAWKAAAAHRGSFESVLVADKRSLFAAAAHERLERLAAPVRSRCAEAVEAIAWAAALIDPRSYHLAFVDPYNLGDLPWEAFTQLLPLQHIDFIVHFSQADLTRNLDRYFAKERSVLDRFAPGWREHVPEQRGSVQMRGQFFGYWISLFEGYQLAENVPLFVNSKNAPLYRMVLLSRHPLATKIWTSVASPQRLLQF